LNDSTLTALSRDTRRKIWFPEFTSSIRARADLLYGVRIFPPFSIHVRFSLDAP